MRLLQAKLLAQRHSGADFSGGPWEHEPQPPRFEPPPLHSHLRQPIQLCWGRLEDTADTLGAHLPDIPNAARARGWP
jgi:hypothetical protein